jgi:hemoglobin-like flavoprotein
VYGLKLETKERKHAMNPQQITLVQHSFAQVVPTAETAAALFYERLFTLDPGVKTLFTGDTKHQGRMLMQAIGFVVKGLQQLETILPAVQALGKRHKGYGVRGEHYDTVGAALLWTLEQGLGDAFTSEVKAAWTEAYTLLATVMQEAAAL